MFTLSGFVLLKDKEVLTAKNAENAKEKKEKI
jgi:hypothetical protein